MPEKRQSPPVEHVDPHVTALLRFRYDTYLAHPVSLSDVARRVVPGIPLLKRRTLERKIGRFFHEGVGGRGERWSYLVAEIRIGFPLDSQEDRVRHCAEIYLRAYPGAKDCPYRHADTDFAGMRGAVRRWSDDVRAQLWAAKRGRTEDLSEQEVRTIIAPLLTVLDRHDLLNPCRVWMAQVGQAQRADPSLIETITMCDEELGEIDRSLSDFPPEATPVLRPYIQDHRREHRRSLTTPITTPRVSGAGGVPPAPDTRPRDDGAATPARLATHSELGSAR
ncbi:hypothetical protein FAIPA1_50156 [Frankia sp. AiPs1]